MRLPGDLRRAVASGYLCMRAIDEIEDHPDLPAGEKAVMLEQIGETLSAARTESELEALSALVQSAGAALPRVSRLLPQHAMMAPDGAAQVIWKATAEMALRMGHWARSGWRILGEADLDAYTFDVAGRVGLMLNALWKWYDGTDGEPDLAVGFGRGLQAVNILRNRTEDEARGVSYFPPAWTAVEMMRYTRRQLDMGESYLARLPEGPAREFCQIPLRLAQATLEALDAGADKLTRDQVIDLIGQ